jgi:hypothetical protein
MTLTVSTISPHYSEIMRPSDVFSSYLRLLFSSSLIPLMVVAFLFEILLFNLLKSYGACICLVKPGRRWCQGP